MSDQHDSEEPLLVTLADEAGTEREFQLIHTLQVDGREYGVLIPHDDAAFHSEHPVDVAAKSDIGEEEDDGDLVVLRIGRENGEEYLEEIEDEAEFQKVVAALESAAENEEISIG